MRLLSSQVLKRSPIPGLETLSMLPNLHAQPQAYLQQVCLDQRKSTFMRV